MHCQGRERLLWALKDRYVFKTASESIRFCSMFSSRRSLSILCKSPLFKNIYVFCLIYIYTYIRKSRCSWHSVWHFVWFARWDLVYIVYMMLSAFARSVLSTPRLSPSVLAFRSRKNRSTARNQCTRQFIFVKVNLIRISVRTSSRYSKSTSWLHHW